MIATAIRDKGTHLEVLLLLVVGGALVLVAVAAVLHGQHHVACLHNAVLGPLADEVERQHRHFSAAEGRWQRLAQLADVPHSATAPTVPSRVTARRDGTGRELSRIPSVIYNRLL